MVNLSDNHKVVGVMSILRSESIIIIIMKYMRLTHI